MMIVRAALTVVLVSGLLATPLAAEAQQPGRAPVVGVLLLGPPTPTPLTTVFKEALRELGYVEGQSIAFEYRGAEGKIDRFPALAAELVQRRVDIIFAPGAPAVRAAKDATTTIPIVFTVAADPVAFGLVHDLAKPGGNVTGITEEAPGLSQRRVALIREILPRAKRVAILWHPGAFGEQLGREMARDVEDGARSAGLEAQVLAAQSPDDFTSALAMMTQDGVDALLVQVSPMFFAQRQRLAQLAAQHHVPTLYPWREFVEAGGLMSYGVNLASNLRRAAIYVDRILKGANPADLPVEQPTKLELVINLKTAKALGLTIPRSLLLQADQVIE
ncbi:MAG TPA: ABC transporter substrate-binding protein [Gemmatimonadales bacterium]|nr:ABC transporter substrate-binding protein [Gemmatimonadales bacterium]